MYVAARGGEQAILNAEQLFHSLKSTFNADDVRRVESTMPYLIDKVMGEGSLYAPELAALAILYTGGDLYESVLMLRAFRSTQPRIAYAKTLVQDDWLTVRRISAAFKDIPGGQILGPTLDYSHRLLPLEMLDNERDHGPISSTLPVQMIRNSELLTRQASLPAVADWQRAEGLLPELPFSASSVSPDSLPDVTREPMHIPADRAVRLQLLGRADTGGILSLGYANMRGYGTVHPTVNELRLGYADVTITHPVSGEPFSIGRVRLSQAEIVTTFKGAAEKPELALGYCATIGWNEIKCIAGSMLDMAMDLPKPHPSHTEDYVLHHTDPVESSGFCIHYKLPHYVTFGSDLDAMRAVTAAGDYLKTTGASIPLGTPGSFSENAPNGAAKSGTELS